MGQKGRLLLVIEKNRGIILRQSQNLLSVSPLRELYIASGDI